MLRQWPAGPLAQLAEQRTFNPRVQGSIPWRPTASKIFREFRTGRWVPISLGMDGLVLDGVPATPAHPATRREFMRLTVAALAFPAAVGLAVHYTGVIAEAHSDLSFTAPFPGWQVWATEAALGALVVAAVVCGFRWLRRRYRALRDRTPHRRAIVMAAVLPGLFIGGTVGLPFEPALSWASEHTASAHSARAHFLQMMRDMRRAPLATPMHNPPAPPAMANPLLRPADLGSDWYPSLRPDPVSDPVRIDAEASGAVERARSWMTQAHRDGQGWALGLGLFETETRFGSPAQARHYARVLASGKHACPCDDHPGPVTRGHIRNVAVWSARNSSHLWGVFAVNDRVFKVLVLSDQTSAPSPAQLTRPLRLAVLRALQS